MISRTSKYTTVRLVHQYRSHIQKPYMSYGEDGENVLEVSVVESKSCPTCYKETRDGKPKPLAIHGVSIGKKNGKSKSKGLSSEGYECIEHSKVRTQSEMFTKMNFQDRENVLKQLNDLLNDPYNYAIQFSTRSLKT